MSAQELNERETRARRYADICVRSLLLHLNANYPEIGRERMVEMVCEIAKEIG